MLCGGRTISTDGLGEGADSEEHSRKVEAISLGVTLREQATWFLDHVKNRKRKAIKPATATSWTEEAEVVSQSEETEK